MKVKECMDCHFFSSSPIQFPCGRCIEKDAVVGANETCESYVERGTYENPNHIKIKTNLSIIEILEMACKPKH